MARYFFDCFDGATRYTDPHGIEIASRDEVADHGAALVRELMNERGDKHGLWAASVTVRSADGTQIYAAHCTFHGWEVSN